MKHECQNLVPYEWLLKAPGFYAGADQNWIRTLQGMKQEPVPLESPEVGPMQST